MNRLRLVSWRVGPPGNIASFTGNDNALICLLFSAGERACKRDGSSYLGGDERINLHEVLVVLSC